MRVAIATCAAKPDLLTGDRLFVAELATLGIEAAPLIWTDPEGLEKPWDAILVRSVWDYYRRCDEFLAWLERAGKKVPSILNSAETIRWNADKRYLRDLASQGIDCVPTIFLPKGGDGESALQQVRETGWGLVVAKPAISGSAFLTAKVSVGDDSLGSALRAAQAHSDVLVQPFLPSIVEGGEVSLIFFNGTAPEYSHATLKVPQRGDFRVQSDFGGKMQAFEAGANLVKFAASTLRGIRGDWVFARVDLIDWKTRPLLSELEVLEPDLYLQYSDRAPAHFARALAEKLRGPVAHR